MNAIKSPQHKTIAGPSIFALLVDDINKMTEPEQKLLWMKINKKKISAYAKAIDASVTPHNLSSDEIDALISEARSHGKRKKN